VLKKAYTMDELYIGTSGYSYAFWKNRFYPEKLAVAKQLNYYSSRFNTVELNYTFYRFPSVKALQKATDNVSDDFRFSVKAHKTITHTLRMKNAKEKITEFMDIVSEGLNEKLACVLYQLPPSFHFSEERLEDILNNIAHHSGNVIEFRHASWWIPKVYDALRDAGLTFCSVSFPGLPEDNIKTSPVFYKRMHGVPELFKSSYSKESLEQLAAEIPNDGTSFVYFNNTMFEAGYSNAEILKDILNQGNP
jgi:uncharacterized protein YecE (DUF72 family)